MLERTGGANDHRVQPLVRARGAQKIQRQGMVHDTSLLAPGVLFFPRRFARPRGTCTIPNVTSIEKSGRRRRMPSRR
jgi:hypothetical protein